MRLLIATLVWAVICALVGTALFGVKSEKNP